MHNIFLISDTHFYHSNIVKYCNRPFCHETLMIKNWNNIVKENDIVIHLGDFALGYDKINFNSKKECYKHLLDNLNGQKYLVRGNHDRETKSFYKQIGFIEVYDYFILNDALLLHYPLVKNYNIMCDKLIAFIKKWNTFLIDLI